MKNNLISDYFDVKRGSKIWPSTDPTDSPVDKFTCKICGWSFYSRMYGSFSPLDTNPFDEFERKEKEHFLIHVYENVKKYDKHLAKAINKGFKESMLAQAGLLKKHMQEVIK